MFDILALRFYLGVENHKMFHYVKVVSSSRMRFNPLNHDYQYC